MRGASRFRKMETDRAFLGWPVPETGTHRLAGTAGGARSGPTVDGGGGSDDSPCGGQTLL